MDARHIVKHHLLIPVGVLIAVLAVGAPLSFAVVAGMMAGCLSMVFMMAMDSRGHESATTDDRVAQVPHRVHRSER